MNGFWGADTDALRTMGTVLARRANALSDLEGMLASTIDTIDWVGEDAEHFRAEWTRLVRTGLQDQEVELRLQARRLTQQADEQDAVSAPDGASFGGGGGGWSSPGEFLRDMFQLAEGVLGNLLGGGSGPLSGQEGPLAELLREVLSTPGGRDAFLGAFLSSVLGGLLADMVSRAVGLGMALESLLTGLGPGAGLSNLIGASSQVPAEAAAPQPAAAETPADGAADAGQSASGGSSAAGEGGSSAGGGGAESSGSGDSGGGTGGGGAGSGSSDGGGSGGASADGAAGGGSTGAEGGADAAGAGGFSGTQATADGPAQSDGSWTNGPLRASADDGPTSLLERLLEMLGDAKGPGSAGASSIGEDIGTAGLGETRR